MSFIPLRAGVLSLALQPEEGAIRYVYAGPYEILRGISAPIRDHLWMTVQPEVSELEIEQKAESFRVTFTARCRTPAVDFRWQGEIAGTADGTLTFNFAGEALRDFQRNRIGFCVLHAAEAAGVPCTLEHIDGRNVAAVLPRPISPRQPFHELRALTHEIAPGLRAEVRFEGDTFETEDQRNWTDASFKTYCTPLALSRPVLLPKGTRIQQTVTVRLHGQFRAAPASFAFPWRQPAAVDVTIGDQLGASLPDLGVTWNAGRPSESTLLALRPLQLGHLRIDLRLADPSFPKRLREAAAAAVALSTSLEPAVFVDDTAERQFPELIDTLRLLVPAPHIARWLVFHEAHASTPPGLVAQLRRFLAPTPFIAPIGGGSTDNFTELNREPAIATTADFTVHACNPQVHAFDSVSLIETLAIQGATVDNARRLSGGSGAVISPITFTSRWPLGAADGPPAVPAGLMPFREDPRHASLFAGAWTLGSIASLSAHGATSATYYEATGANGVISAEGKLLPVGQVLQRLAPFKGATVIATESGDPLRIAALALENDGRRLLFLANLGTAPQRVNVRGHGSLRSLDVAPHSVELLEFL